MKKIILLVLVGTLLVSCSSNNEGKVEKTAKQEISAFDKAKEESDKLYPNNQETSESKDKPQENNTNISPNQGQQLNQDKPKVKYTICIDPGHQRHQITEKEPIAPGASEKKQGVTSGAQGVSTKKEEYQLNLEVSMLLKQKLIDKGYNVVMTRESNDVSLSNVKRAEIGNQCNANLVVRIHADSNESSSAMGYSVLYPSGKYTTSIQDESKKAANIIEKNIKTITASKSRGIIPRDDMTGFNWSKVPSVIVEMGFLSNSTEDKMLSDKNYQEKMANGIVNGIDEYIKLK